MTEFENLKMRYYAILHIGLTQNPNYNEAKFINGILHKFCESLVDGSYYSDYDKRRMKAELQLEKESLSAEIDTFYQKQ